MLKKIPPCSDLLSLFRYYVCFDNTQHGRIVPKQAKSKDFARVDFLSTFSLMLILTRCTSVGVDVSATLSLLLAGLNVFSWQLEHVSWRFLLRVWDV
jgi:hypothetical protein